MIDQILAKLVQSELLSEETKTEISKQMGAQIETFRTQVREEVSGEVRLELAEQWTAEREELIGKVDTFVAEALTKELSELRGDIDRFRDLEAEYAAKLVEEKHSLAAEVATELDQLVEKIDAFFEIRLASEMEELKEDLEIVKQNTFGRKIFEAFSATFGESYVDENAVQSKLAVTEAKLASAERALATREKELGVMVREAKMEAVLSPLTGMKREQMAMVLKNVDTERLEESYKHFVPRILKEAALPLTEGKRAEHKTTVVTGNSASTLVESAQVQKSQGLADLRRLAGII